MNSFIQQTQHVSVINSCKNITAVVSPTFLPASVSFLAPGNLKKRQTPFILNNKLDNTSTLCVSTYQSTWLCRLICDTSACLFIKSLVCVSMCVLACKKKSWLCTCVTSTVRAEGDQPAEPWRERALYLAEHVTWKKNISGKYRMRNKLEQQKNSPQTVFQWKFSQTAR